MKKKMREMERLKHIVLFVVLLLLYNMASAQQYIDAVVVNEGKDTLFGKVVEITDSTLTIDQFNLVFSLSQDQINAFLPNFREATKIERTRMKQIESLSEEDLGYKTSGYYLRKSAPNFYLGISLAFAGSITSTLALTTFDRHNTNPNLKWTVFTCGSIVTAGGLFFLLRCFYFIDKAGKIMDLDRASLHLSPTSDGNIGLKLKF